MNSPRRFRSASIYDGTLRATTRRFLHALGQDDEDIARPHVGVFHTGGEMSACNLNLRDQAQHATAGACAGRFTANTKGMVPAVFSEPARVFDSEEAAQGAVTHSGPVTWLRDET